MDPLLQRLHHRATERAREHRRGPAIEHLFLVLIEEPTVRELLVRAGLDDVDGFARDIEYIIRYAPAYSEDRLGRFLDFLEKMFATAGHKAISLDLLLITLANQRNGVPPIEALRGRGVEAIHLLQAIAHGKRLAPELPAPSLVDRMSGGRTGRYRVVLHDDRVTSLAFVIRVLTQVIELPQAEAIATAKRIEADKRVAFGPYPWRKALNTHDSIVALAHAELQPLRVSCEA